MKVDRCDYLVLTNSPKVNGEPLSKKDLINVGYMAGRYGINLEGNYAKHKIPEVNENGTKININCCTAELLESNLNQAGIKFNQLA